LQANNILLISCIENSAYQLNSKIIQRMNIRFLCKKCRHRHP